jgi:O-antigen ligase
LAAGGFNAFFGRFANEDVRYAMDFWGIEVGRVGAVWGYAPPFATFLSALLPGFVCLWLAHKTSARGLFALFSFVLVTIILFLTGARMEFVGAMAGLVVVLWAWGVRIRGVRRVRAGVLATLVAALVIASVLSTQGSAEGNVFGRLARLFQSDDPSTTTIVGERKAVYEGLLGAWRSNPILGVGLGNTQDVTQQATASIGWRGLASPHSYYLGLLAQTGSVGAGIVVLMLVAMIPHYRRLLRPSAGPRQRVLGVFALSLSVAVLVGGIADNALYVWQVGVLFWLVQGAVLSLSVRGEDLLDASPEGAELFGPGVANAG